MRANLSEETLIDILEDGEMSLENRKVKAKSILSATEDIIRYGIFEKSQQLGIVYSPQDLLFSDFLLFESIKEAKGSK